MVILDLGGSCTHGRYPCKRQMGEEKATRRQDTESRRYGAPEARKKWGPNTLTSAAGRTGYSVSFTTFLVMLCLGERARKVGPTERLGGPRPTRVWRVQTDVWVTSDPPN